MTSHDLLRVNFTLSAAAKRGIRALREEYDARFSTDPAAVLSVAWGYVEGTEPLSGNVVVSFYPRSMAADIAHGIQEVSGEKFVYFTTARFHPLFEGRVLDHSAERGFFLRAP